MFTIIHNQDLPELEIISAFNNIDVFNTNKVFNIIKARIGKVLQLKKVEKSMVLKKNPAKIILKLQASDGYPCKNFNFEP